MKVVFSAKAAEELDHILLDISRISPRVFMGFDERLWAVIRRIGEWPQSAQTVADRPDIRMVPLQRYPYRVFYRINPGSIEIVHIRHTARVFPDDR